MSGKQWKLAFRAGETLQTEMKPRPFLIVGFEKGGIAVRLLARKKKPTILLTYQRLDALLKFRKELGDGRLTESVNRVWEQEGLGEDTKNESQYWAMVCERVRRKKGVDADVVYYEGSRVVFTSNRFERNPKLRQDCIAKCGLRCCVCDVEFSERYGALGNGFIHIHHLKPLAFAGKMHKVKTKDLVPVCANCHAMLHQRTPPHSPEELRAMMQTAKAQLAGDLGP